MRLLVWILGVLVTLGDLMIARNVAPAWVWVWWVWLGLWVLVGGVVLIAALVRAAATAGGRGVPRVPAPLSAPGARVQRGE